MVSIPKVGLMSCGFLLCLGLSNVAQAEKAPSASDVMKTNCVTDRAKGGQAGGKPIHDELGGSRAEGAKTIKGNAVQAGNVPAASDIMKTDCVTDRGQAGQADEQQMTDKLTKSK